MRVGLNLLFVTPQAGGAGRYARELVRAMPAAAPHVELTAFVSAEAPEDWMATHPEVTWVRAPVTITHGSKLNSVRSLGTQWFRQALAARERRLDVLHGLANVVALAAPGVPRVVTLLDLIWMRDTESLGRWGTVTMKAAALPSVRRATRVVAISEAARDDIVATLGIDPRRIDVTPLGIRLGVLAEPTPEPQLRAQLGLGDGPVVLCVAQKRSHKNLEALVRALPLLEARDAVVVIPGAPTPYEDRLRAVAAELGVTARLVLPPWVGEADLEGLYALADAFALPSLEEGFGLPVLEAMARDVPVACSDVSSLPEVTAGAAELFDPRDPADVARALDVLLGSAARREALVERGRRRCAEMTWERTARATVASYERALG